MMHGRKNIKFYKGMLFLYRSQDWYRTLNRYHFAKNTYFIFSLPFLTLMSCGVTLLLIFNYSLQQNQLMNLFKIAKPSRLITQAD
jgi:hypothetical protein